MTDMPGKETIKQTECIHGIHSVVEALKARRRTFFEIIISNDKPSDRIQQIIGLADTHHIPVLRKDPAALESMAKTDLHQGVVAKTGPYPLADLSDIMGKRSSAGDNVLILMLDSILDPHNLGALVRTALCAGVHGIVIPKDRSAQPTPAVSRISAGALEHIQVARATNLVTAISELKESGVWIAGLDTRAKRSFYEHDFTGPVAIIIGGEEKGIRPLVKHHCDFLMSIPQKGPVNSLNASVAGAVVLYEIFRQRSTGKDM